MHEPLFRVVMRHGISQFRAFAWARCLSSRMQNPDSYLLIFSLAWPMVMRPEHQSYSQNNNAHREQRLRRHFFAQQNRPQ